jgi:hypothetical protein
MEAVATKIFKPKVPHPYYFDETHTGHLVSLLKNSKEIDVRIGR